MIAEGEKVTLHVTKISTPLTMQVTAILPLVVQNTPAPLDVQHTLVLLSLANWQVQNQVASCCYMTTVHINAQAHDLHGLVPTAKCCRVIGTSMVSEHTVY